MPHPEAEQVHQDLVHLAQALDGVAGALHEGHPVDLQDLDAAALAARNMWDAGPEPDEFHNDDFEAARADLVRYAAHTEPVTPRECGLVERAVHRMAQDLRWLAHVAQDEIGRKVMPKSAEVATDRLLSRYARFSAHATATF